MHHLLHQRISSISLAFLGLLCASAVFAADEAVGPNPVAPNPKDPQYQTKGEQNRTYLFPGTTESIPYHLYVPSKWKPGVKLPLVIVLRLTVLPVELAAR